jgi:hypothetical protein
MSGQLSDRDDASRASHLGAMPSDCAVGNKKPGRCHPNTIPASCHPPCAEAAVASRSATACSSTLLNEPAKIDWLPPLVGC